MKNLIKFAFKNIQSVTLLLVDYTNDNFLEIFWNL